MPSRIVCRQSHLDRYWFLPVRRCFVYEVKKLAFSQWNDLCISIISSAIANDVSHPLLSAELISSLRHRSFVQISIASHLLLNITSQTRGFVLVGL